MKRRYNIFNQIHKGLRAMMYDTSICLQRADFLNRQEAEQVLVQLESLLDLFVCHACHEDAFILPLVNRYSRDLAKEFDSEHEKDEFMTHRLRSLVAVYRNAATEESQLNGGEAIARGFNEFIAFNLYHMNKEEEKINPILWEYYSDTDIIGIQQSILCEVSEEESRVAGKWMMLGINDAEIVAWLRGIKNSAPSFVFLGIITLAERVLPADRWERIQGGLTEGLQLA